SGPVFSLEKLQSINGQYIRGMQVDELARRLIDRDYVRQQIPLVQERMRTLNEFHTSTEFFFQHELAYDRGLLIPNKADRVVLAGWLQEVRSLLQASRPW